MILEKHSSTVLVVSVCMIYVHTVSRLYIDKSYR